ncbi:MAG: hypothetical protein KGH69_03525 [Candidatus Micrarchaeota archaeon]|nr:hypothetical protein [Candidatus Micrarchaeota archaeon]
MQSAYLSVPDKAAYVLMAIGAACLALLVAAPSSVHAFVSYIYCVGSSGYAVGNLSYYAQISANGIGEWHAMASYPVGVDDSGCAIYDGYIYCVGTNVTLSENQVYYAAISSTGVSAWKATTPYPIKFWLAGCSAYDGYIYCVGDWLAPSTQVYYAPVSNRGVGNWTSTTSYPIPMYWSGCSINAGYIYCVGSGAVHHKDGEVEPQPSESGANDSNQTYYAKVSRSGIGNWTRTTNYPGPMIFGGCSIYGSYIYCIGGEWLANETYYAHVSPNGIGNWTRTTDVPIVVTEGACPIHNGYIYCVGSRNSSSTGHQVWYAKVSSRGIGAWNESTPYPIPAWGDSYCQIPGSGGGFLGGGGPEQ